MPASARPLLLLLLASAILGACWALLVPAWQSPDENAHFGYAQTIAERGRPPGTDVGPRFSIEQRDAARAIESDQLAINLFARAEWSDAIYERWRDLQAGYGSGSRNGGGGDPAGGEGPNAARVNPPLYYIYELVPYFAASGADLFGRFYLMRLWSVLLLLVAASATWMLVGELFGTRPELQLGGAALVALEPMASFMSASVNPDGMLIASFAVALWLGVRIIRRGLTPATAIGLCAATAVAILAKATGYALVPAVALALVAGALRAGVGLRVRELFRAALPLLALAIPVAAWVLYTRLSGRPAVNGVAGAVAGEDALGPGMLSYLWQFYLPHLPGQEPLPPGYPPVPAFDFWIEGGWGRFGWLEIKLPEPFYIATGLLTIGLLVGAGIAVLRSGLRRHALVVAFLGLVVVALLGGLHLTEHRVLQSQGIAFNQGRYLLPVLPVLGLAAAATLSLARGRWRELSTGGLVGFLLALQIVSLAVVGARFYA